MSLENGPDLTMSLYLFFEVDIGGIDLPKSRIFFHTNQFQYDGLSDQTYFYFKDSKMNIYCEEDYNLKKALRCAYCKKPIVPKANEKTVPRLRALGKDFHPTCFKCEVN